MKTITHVTELTHDELVDLLCTATYGSCWLEIYAPDREGLVIEDRDCCEDIWAKALLAGKKIEFIDHYADGDVYGSLGQVDEDNDGIYLIGIEDIMKGLGNAADGTFNGDGIGWARECIDHFREGDGSMDQPEAEALVQIIMFNEIIYG